jgi:hypothetical protein
MKRYFFEIEVGRIVSDLEKELGISLPVKKSVLDNAFWERLNSLKKNEGSYRSFLILMGLRRLVDSLPTSRQIFTDAISFGFDPLTDKGNPISALIQRNSQKINGIPCRECQERGFFEIFSFKASTCYHCSGSGLEPYRLPCSYCYDKLVPRADVLKSCPKCQGKGMVTNPLLGRLCFHCLGSGILEEETHVNVRYKECEACSGKGFLPRPRLIEKKDQK